MLFYADNALKIIYLFLFLISLYVAVVHQSSVAVKYSLLESTVQDFHGCYILEDRYSWARRQSVSIDFNLSKNYFLCIFTFSFFLCLFYVFTFFRTFHIFSLFHCLSFQHVFDTLLALRTYTESFKYRIIHTNS